MELYQIKVSVQQRKQSTIWRGSLWNKSKCLQTICLLRGWYSKYVRNSYNSTARKTNIWFQNRQRTRTDIFLKYSFEEMLVSVREMQTKTSVRYYLISLRMPAIRNSKDNKMLAQTKISLYVCRKVKLV